MFTSKKIFCAILAIFAFSLLFAQENSSGVSKLTERYLEKAQGQYDAKNYKEAYKAVNAALHLNADAMPANVIVIGTQIYTKVLDEIAEKKDYVFFEEVTANLEEYSVIADSKIKSKVKQIYKQQEEELKEKQAAAAKAEREEQYQIYQDMIDKNSADSEKVLEAINKNQQAMADNLKSLSDSVHESSKSTGKIFWLILIVVVILLCVFILVFFGVAAAARAAKRRNDALDSTLKMIAGMQQANNQLLLGGVTDLHGINGGLKLAGSSTWGQNALPAPEMSEKEKAELKQLAIDCEALGVKIDQYTKRKNNSKNISELVYKLAMQLGLNQNTSMIYFCAAMVYDAGFLAYPEDMFGEAELTETEREDLRKHVEKASDYLGFVPEKYFKIFDGAARYHHENMDGTGFPFRLLGEEIPQVARLIHVAESYNSLISRRNYKEIKDKESAVEELKKTPGFYDPDVVAVLDAIV